MTAGMAGLAEELATVSCIQREVCWVCLEEDSPGKQMTCPCACPRPVHPSCLARWQLHSAGSREETQCRFCKCSLPDWKSVLSPACSGVESDSTSGNPRPTMSVTFNGQIHHVVVKGGPGGYEAFVNDIRRMFGITEELDMHLAFDCADPLTGQLVKLNGSGAFQAAVHCATISAAKRMRSNSPRTPTGREAAPRIASRQSRFSQEAPASTRTQPPRRASARRHSSAGDVTNASDTLMVDPEIWTDMDTSMDDPSQPALDALLHQLQAESAEADAAAMRLDALDTPAKLDMLQAWLNRVRATLTSAGPAAMAATALASTLTDPTTAQLLALQVRLQGMLADLTGAVSSN